MYRSFETATMAAAPTRPTPAWSRARRRVGMPRTSSTRPIAAAPIAVARQARRVGHGSAHPTWTKQQQATRRQGDHRGDPHAADRRLRVRRALVRDVHDAEAVQ